MAALRAAVFPLSAKNRRGGHFLPPPPSSARVVQRNHSFWRMPSFWLREFDNNEHRAKLNVRCLAGEGYLVLKFTAENPAFFRPLENDQIFFL